MFKFIVNYVHSFTSSIEIHAKKNVHDTNIKHNTLTSQQTCTSPWSHIDKRGVDEEKIKKGSSDKCHISNHQVSLQKKTCMCKRTDQISKIFF